jgi:Spy/CpxP family protein refolding chaperone
MLSKHIVIAIALGALFAAAPAMGQGKGRARGGPDYPQPGFVGPGMGGPGAGPRHDRGGEDGLRRQLMESLYPVELIRENAGEIKLTDEQIEKLRKLVSDVRNEIEQIEWDLEREGRKLVEIVKKGATKEEVYAQLDVIFGYENKVKKKHLGLMIVVRDVLNAKQRGQLDEIKAEREKEREQWRERRPDRGPGPGPDMPPPGPPPGPPGPPPGPQMDF